MITEQYKIKGIEVNVMRGDKGYVKPYPAHLKMKALENVVINANANNYDLVGCFCTTHGIWPFGLPHIAQAHGINSVVYYPATNMEKVPTELHPGKVNLSRYRLVLLHPNFVAINAAQAKKGIESLGGYYIPFGVDEPIAVQTISRQFILSKDIGTLIVPCGSGVTLAGVLLSLSLSKTKVDRIIAVSAGRPSITIQRTISKYVAVPPGLVDWVVGYKYEDIPDVNKYKLHMDELWPLHPYYELKAFDWLYKNIMKLPQPINFLTIGSITR